VAEVVVVPQLAGRQQELPPPGAPQPLTPPARPPPTLQQVRPGLAH
jgi:hypothetical protein